MAVLPRIELSGDETARVRASVLRTIGAFGGPAIVLSYRADGVAQTRLMTVRSDDRFHLTAISIKPSAKLEELAANPAISVLWFQMAVDDEDSDQPYRYIEIRGRCQILTTAAEIAAVPGVRTPSPAEEAGDKIGDEELEARRAVLSVTPTRVRCEGFVPGPRYPIYLQP